ncbi:SURF1 family protein [Nonomuraea sp. KC401]|uniref:SURF1 family protein n=1 Tax=unclassified Nonomuraea TaxID=2593643 RepID=UPI0010FD2F90|nr:MULTISPECIES: SURF1 family protein [unclassified Nonomuraea]NBE96689.1 SURF1 family protein [Nonomuraea sp. K271]TLF67951.1 SURF1 family protein [Nonomuraea sp. KC401]
MLRTLLSPRLLGLHVLTVGVLIAFILLGRWQLGVFHDSGRPRASTDPAPVAVTTLAQVSSQLGGEAVSRRVTAEGVYDAGRQLLVADRRPDVDAPGGNVSRDHGYWVLTPLRLDDGTLMPVVRGWAKTSGDPAVAAVPEGRVAVSGRLRPQQGTDSVQRRGEGLPAGQVQTVSTGELVNLWTGEKVRAGYVVAQPPSGSLAQVKVDPPVVGGTLTWRNLAYAANWWIFAGFAVFMWFHFVRDAVRADRERGKSPEMALEG